MKRFLLLFLFVFLLCIPVFAMEDDDVGSMSDFFGKKGTVFDDPFVGQKQYTDEEFQKALEEKKSQLKKKRAKKTKGDGHSDLDSAVKIDETVQKTIILMVSNNLLNGDGAFIPIGHYKIVGVEEDSKVFLDFYQSHIKVARVPAVKTRYDFGKPDINFAEIIPYDNCKVKVIFGSLDFNAWTLLRIVDSQ